MAISVLSSFVDSDFMGYGLREGRIHPLHEVLHEFSDAWGPQWNPSL